jgi:uncharacterized protein with HEPN domain
MDKQTLELLQTMLTGIKKVQELAGNFTNADEFKNHSIANHAVILNFISVSDAVKKIDESAKAQITTIQWDEFDYLEKKVADVRFTLDLDLAWELIHTKVPRLKAALNNCLNKYGQI